LYEDNVHKKQEGSKFISDLIACQTQLVIGLSELFKKREVAILDLLDCKVLDDELQAEITSQQQSLSDFIANESKKKKCMTDLFQDITYN
jgi:hypothetical protein